MTILAFRGGLGDTTGNPAPTALQSQLTVLVDSVTQQLGAAQSTLSDIAASGLDDATHTYWQNILDAIAQEIDAVRSGATAMNAAEANDAIATLRDDQRQLTAAASALTTLRSSLVEGVSIKTLGYGVAAVAVASLLGYWLISRRREVRRARRLKKSRR